MTGSIAIPISLARHTTAAQAPYLSISPSQVEFPALLVLAASSQTTADRQLPYLSVLPLDQEGHSAHPFIMKRADR